MMPIFIFHDYVHHSGPLYSALALRYGPEKVRYVTAADILAGVLHEEPTAFVRPGGASRYGASKLSGAGYRAIRAYVARGGTYLGICGGAYDACARTRWAVGTDHELAVDNELALFAADAVGPIAEFCNARDREGTEAKLVSLDIGARRIRTLYWGGGRFVPHAGARFVEHARYADLGSNAAAVVSGSFGEGRWLLSSPHLEYDHAALQLSTFDVPSNHYTDISRLTDTDDVSLEPFHQLLDSLIR